MVDKLSQLTLQLPVLKTIRSKSLESEKGNRVKLMPNRQAVCTLTMSSLQSVGVGLDEAKDILKGEVHKCQQNSVKPSKKQAAQAAVLLTLPPSMIDLKEEEKLELEDVVLDYRLGSVGLL